MSKREGRNVEECAIMETMRKDYGRCVSGTAEGSRE